MADMNLVNNQTNELENIATELASVQRLLSSTKDRLKANWAGNAYNNYIKAANELDSDIKKSQNNIINLAKNIRTAAMQLSAQKK